METVTKDNLVFYISKEMIQEEAKQRIGRNLNFEEIEICRNGLEWGLLTSIDPILQTIFTEML
jgi:hypothetical protein